MENLLPLIGFSNTELLSQIVNCVIFPLNFFWDIKLTPFPWISEYICPLLQTPSVKFFSVVSFYVSFLTHCDAGTSQPSLYFSLLIFFSSWRFSASSRFSIASHFISSSLWLYSELRFVHALLKMGSGSGHISAVPGLCSSLLLLLRKRETRVILACRVSHAAGNAWRRGSPVQNFSFPLSILCFWVLGFCLPYYGAWCLRMSHLHCSSRGSLSANRSLHYSLLLQLKMFSSFALIFWITDYHVTLCRFKAWSMMILTALSDWWWLHRISHLGQGSHVFNFSYIDFDILCIL